MAEKPDFLFNYWRPWRDDSSLLDSMCNYAKDTSMAEYQARLVAEQMSKSMSVNNSKPDRFHNDGPRYFNNNHSRVNELKNYSSRNRFSIDEQLMQILETKFDISGGIVFTKKDQVDFFTIDDKGYIGDERLKDASTISVRFGHVKVMDDEDINSLILLITFSNYSHMRKWDNPYFCFMKNGKPNIISSTYNICDYEEADTGRIIYTNTVSFFISEDDLASIAKNQAFGFNLSKEVWADGGIFISGEDVISLLYLSHPKQFSPESKEFILNQLTK